MAQSQYFQRTDIRRQDPNAVQRGLQVGETIGKLLGNLGTAIKGAQKDAIANRLMTDQNIANQPGAGKTFDLGTLDGGGGSQPGGPQPAAGNTVDPNADLSTDLPQDVSTAVPSVQVPPDVINNPGISNQQNVPGTGGTYSGTNTDPVVAQNVAAARLSGGPQPAAQIAGDNWNLSQFGGGSGFGDNSSKGTVGGLIGSGGVEGLQLQKEMAAQKIQQQNADLSRQKGQLDLADRQAEASGTGRYAMDNAIKRAQLLAAQKRALGDKTVDLDKNPPTATNLDTEPVLNESQLEKTVDGTYGKGAYAGMSRTINEPDTIPDPKGAIDPSTGKVAQIPNPNGPIITGDSITLGPKSKRITMPLNQAAILAKQHNSVNFKKGLPLIRVPGETDQTMGATKDNPYPVQSKLDMVSRAHGTWVRLPSGQIAQVP